jgi:hypothetical protein
MSRIPAPSGRPVSASFAEQEVRPNPASPPASGLSAASSAESSASHPTRLRRTKSTPASAYRTPLPGSRTAPPGPSTSGFAEEVAGHLAQKWRFNRTAFKDRVGGHRYAAARSEELRSLPGDRLAAERFGVSLAVETIAVAKRQGLTFNNPAGVIYPRDSVNPAFHARCRALYEKATGKQPPEHAVYVNCAGAGQRLVDRLELLHPPSGGPRHVKGAFLGRGLYCMDLGNPDLKEKAEKLVGSMGLRPSVYELLRLDCPAPTEAVAPVEPWMLVPVAESRARIDSACGQLEEVTEGHSLQPLSRAAAELLRGLAAELAHAGMAEQARLDPVVANSLAVLANVAQALPALIGDSEQFFSAYRAAAEEAFLILAALRPHGEADFKNACRSIFHERVGDTLVDIGIPLPEAHLFSSGMDAIDNALDIATSLAGSRDIRGLTVDKSAGSPEYFEVRHAWPSPKSNAGTSTPTYSATLNPSTPQFSSQRGEPRPWNADTVVQDLSTRLLGRRKGSRPLTVVLDTTIERPGDLARVLEAMKEPLRSGQLTLVLCKSHFKYSALGTTKAMAGSATVIGADNPHNRKLSEMLKNREADLDFKEKDEFQLLTHTLKYGHRSEFALMDRAARNAEIVQALCFTPDGGISSWQGHDPGVPLAMIGRTVPKEQKFQFKNGTDFQYDRAGLFAHVPVRDSFGFSETVKAFFSNAGSDERLIRLAFGQESVPELVEKFFAAGLRIQKWGAEDGSDAALGTAKDIALEASRQMMRTRPVEAWADAGLRILEQRVGDDPDWKDNLADYSATLALLEEGPDELRTLLRQVLIKDLRDTRALSANPLADDLAVACATGTGRLSSPDRAAGSVVALRARAQLSFVPEETPPAADGRPGLTGEAAFSPHAIASLYHHCADVAARVGDPSPVAFGAPDRLVLDEIGEALLSSGMPRLSPAGRRTVIREMSGLWSRDLRSGNPEAVAAALTGIQRVNMFLVNAEQRSQLLRMIPDAVFAGLDEGARASLLAGLFEPLDADSRFLLLTQLIEAGDFSKASHGLEITESDLRGLEEGGREFVQADGLEGEGSLREQPTDMSTMDRARIQLTQAVSRVRLLVAEMKASALGDLVAGVDLSAPPKLTRDVEARRAELASLMAEMQRLKSRMQRVSDRETRPRRS